MHVRHNERVTAAPAFRVDTENRHAALASEYDNMLACIRCGLCLTSCPTYVLSLHESEGPRGRVGIARALTEGHLQVTPDLVEHELNCLVCDACSAVCPAGVHMDPLQVGLRQALETSIGRRRSLRERLVRAFVFGWLFLDMARFRAFARLMWLYQRSGARWLVRKLGLLKLLGLAEAEQLLPDVPSAFVVPHDETYGHQGAVAVVFFAGCVMSTALAEIDRATLRVLERAGLCVTDPAGQGCCGALHAHSGDSRFRQLAERNIEAFERTEGPIVVNSAGCGAMLKDYAHHFRDDPAWAERARAFSARVRDVSEVLCERSLCLQAIEPTRAVYQDACHLLHAQRISRQPRDLLGRMAGLELREIAEAGLCCGSAGVYNVTNPVQANQLQQRKLDNALAASPDVIVTANPGCLLHLRAGLAERQSPVRVVHLVELLDQASACAAEAQSSRKSSS
jgi:glycolate oxidase iron-sulfur subunit